MLADISASDVSLISEPEAAALYTLRSIQPNSITVSSVMYSPKDLILTLVGRRHVYCM